MLSLLLEINEAIDTFFYARTLSVNMSAEMFIFKEKHGNSVFLPDYALHPTNKDKFARKLFDDFFSDNDKAFREFETFDLRS